MPANISPNDLAPVLNAAVRNDKVAACVKALVDGTYLGLMSFGTFVGTKLETDGNTTFGSLPGTSLVLKESSNGGSTYAASTRTHAFTAGAKALKDFADVGDGNFDTIIEATTAGLNGNLISVELVGDSPGAGGVTINVVNNPGDDGYTVTIHYESGVSTVGDVETAITALAGLDDVIAVKTAGTGATVLTAPDDDAPATFLASGTGVQTIAQIVAELVADTVFMGGGTPDLTVEADGVELLITSLDLGTNILWKVDATSTAIGASKLQFTSDQISAGGGALLKVQVANRVGKSLSGAKEIIVRALGVAGTPTLNDAPGGGTVKKGEGTGEVWCTTSSTGLMELLLNNTTAEDTLLQVETDNGEIEILKVTTPLS